MTYTRRVLFVLLIAAVVSGVAAPGASAEETIKIRISNQLPASQPVSKGLELWKSRMEAAGNGRVVVEVYHNSQLYKDKDVFPAVQAGSVEAGFVVAAQFSAYDPAFGVFDLPMLFPSYEVAVRALAGDLGHGLAQRLDKLGVHTLYWPQQGFVEIATTKQRLARAADFRGLKIRTHSKELSRMVQLLGGAPTVISASEVYTALTRGTIDGLTTSLASYYTRKWFEGAPRATLARFSLIGGVVIMNKAAWDRLPADLKAVAAEASGAAEALSNEGIIAGQSEFVEQLKTRSVQFTEFDAEARRGFLEATRPMYDEFFRATGDAGRQMVEYVHSLK